MIHRSLRGRVALAASSATAVVILLGGFLVTGLVAKNERDALDDRLGEQAAAVTAPVINALTGAPSNESLARFAVQRPDVGTVIRVYVDGSLQLAVGNLEVRFVEPAKPGLSTVQAGDQRWRVHASIIQARTFSGFQAITLLTAVPTQATDSLISNLRLRTLEVALASAVLAGVAGWLLGNVALRPLARLRAAAESVSTSGDLRARIEDAESGPREISDLAHSLNTMLERLQRAAAATDAALASSRAFAGNAAHEMRTPLTSMQANIDVLARNPSLSAEQYQEVVTAIGQEQSRLVSLLDALHTLARGEVVADAQRETTDVADLVGVAIESMRRRFSDVEFVYTVPVESTEVYGWPDGLRVMIDNLLINAARHGGRHVHVAVESALPDAGDADGSVWLVVDDDGPGVPEVERKTIFERFVRGSGATATGSGLGLALVEQQARIHGGEVSVDVSPLGGARFRVRLRS